MGLDGGDVTRTGSHVRRGACVEEPIAAGVVEGEIRQRSKQLRVNVCRRVVLGTGGDVGLWRGAGRALAEDAGVVAWRWERPSLHQASPWVDAGLEA